MAHEYYVNYGDAYPIDVTGLPESVGAATAILASLFEEDAESAAEHYLGDAK